MCVSGRLSRLEPNVDAGTKRPHLVIAGEAKLVGRCWAEMSDTAANRSVPVAEVHVQRLRLERDIASQGDFDAGAHRDADLGIAPRVLLGKRKSRRHMRMANTRLDIGERHATRQVE